MPHCATYHQNLHFLSKYAFRSHRHKYTKGSSPLQLQANETFLEYHENCDLLTDIKAPKI